jgi:predicted metal-dependent peptidase
MSAAAEKLITKARANVFLDHGFFGYILAKHTIHYTDRIPTMAVDSTFNIYVNPEFVMRFSNDNRKLQWALCHEVMHPVLMHLTRRNNRDPKLWNYAGDAVINDLLNSTNVGKPIEGTVNIPGSSAKTTEEVYRELQQQQQQEPQGGESGSSGGDGTGDPYDNGFGDDLIEGNMSESDRQSAEATARVTIAEAAAAAKVRGHLSGSLRAFVDKILESNIAWYDKLHEYMQGLQRNDYSWARPNRRYITQGHYLPSTGTIPKMGEVVIQIDISGSVSQNEAAHFAAHVKRLVSECVPQKIHVLYTDASVQRHDEFESADELEFNFFSAGGTDMTAGFRYCAEHGIEPDVFVCLTDGYTPFGEQQSYPTVWCISNHTRTPSHGVNVPFAIKE